jgi:hypothetical protein
VDITKILDGLRQELAQLDEAILSLERLVAGAKRRGRPPGWIATVKQQTVADRPAVVGGKKSRRKRPASETGENRRAHGPREEGER